MEHAGRPLYFVNARRRAFSRSTVLGLAAADVTAAPGPASRFPFIERRLREGGSGLHLVVGG